MKNQPLPTHHLLNVLYSGGNLKLIDEITQTLLFSFHRIIISGPEKYYKAYLEQ